MVIFLLVMDSTIYSFDWALIKDKGGGGGVKVQGCDIRGVLKENHYLILRIFVLKFFEYIIYFLDLK